MTVYSALRCLRTTSALSFMGHGLMEGKLLSWCRHAHAGFLTLVNSFLQLPPERIGKRRRHSIANLPVLVLDVARKLVAVRKALHGKDWIILDR